MIDDVLPVLKVYPCDGYWRYDRLWCHELLMNFWNVWILIGSSQNNHLGILELKLKFMKSSTSS